MSTENIYSLAQEYEDKFNKSSDLVQLIRQGREGKSRLSEVSQQLENLDYLLNQMDLEVSLLPKEDQSEVNIHKTCRNHFNDLRKKFMEAETQQTKQAKPTPTPDTDTADNSMMGSSTSLTYEQGVQDLRARYGVTTGVAEQSIPEELLVYRRKEIMKRRLMFGGVVMGALLLIYVVVKVL